jgi:serine/threonine-protein kinase
LIGTHLGPYEITAKLGEGGMGEVYRATDTKLDRQVAVKVLPATFTKDEARLSRFEREAKLLAQLHHPHIASIFGLEESDGIQALVMELVEGPTLAERMSAGPLPLEEALPIARQIAEALETAHEKGIIHRDLKPQNVKLTLDGEVKVLDFGLAKAMDPGGVSGAASPMASPTMMSSPTLTAMQGTQLGVILGTAAYMAPEQARGQAVDKRADIWAFGVVLYEMLTGGKLFAAETVSDTLAGVLKTEIDLDRLPEATPPTIRRLLRWCLERNPKNRLRDIGDARLVIDEAVATGEQPAQAIIRGPRRAATMWTAVLIALAVGLLAGRALLTPGAAPTPPMRLEIAFPEGQGLWEADGATGVAFTTDGQRMALALVDSERGTTSGLVWRDLGRLGWQRLEGTEGARAPFFSPDGNWIGYFTETELVKLPLAGGRPIRLAAADARSRGAVWGGDGYIYFTPGTNQPISRISEAGGSLEPVTTLDIERNERTHRWPDLTWDHSAILYTSDDALSPTYYDDARIEAMRLATGERQVVVENASMARLLADDVLVYANGGNLFAIAFDAKKLTTRGLPVALEQEVASTAVGSGAVHFAPSRRGGAIWIGGERRTAIGTPLWFSRDGSSRPAPLQVGVDVLQLALSPDDTRVVLRGGNLQAGIRTQDLWIGDLERGTVTRLTFDENSDHPTWTPDGLRIAYGRDRKPEGSDSPAGREIAWKLADGSREAEVLISEPGAIFAPLDFTPDGRQLLFTRWREADSNSDIWVVDVDPAGEARPFLITPFEEFSATISPDGRWIAYDSNESGRAEIYVRPFPESGGKWLVSNTTGLEPRWSRDGRELFFRNEAGRLFRVEIDTRDGFRASSPEMLFEGLLGGRNPRSYGVSQDSQRFVSLRLFDPSRLSHAVDYSNEWLARARRLLEAR